MTVGVSDRQVVAVRPGAEVEVDVEALPGEPFAGRVLRVGSATDSDTRKFPVEVEVENPDWRLLPGMVARRRRIQVRDVAFQPGVLQVDAGLEAGEMIATTGMRQLSDGASVEFRAEGAP